MDIRSRLDRLHARVRRNRWFRYFAIFNRIALAAGFIPSGMVKILGERFTDLSVNHPLGNYLEAFWHTEYYYTFVGLMQVTAAICLLIPRTALLGAFIYFPIILNIWVLSIALRFDGSFVSATLMVLANLYLFAWYWDRWRDVLPFRRSVPERPRLEHSTSEPSEDRFPFLFFGGVAAVVAGVVLWFVYGYDVMPRNTMEFCVSDAAGRPDSAAYVRFCECVHMEGAPLGECLDRMEEWRREGRNPSPP